MTAFCWLPPDRYRISCPAPGVRMFQVLDHLLRLPAAAAPRLTKPARVFCASAASPRFSATDKGGHYTLPPGGLR